MWLKASHDRHSLPHCLNTDLISDSLCLWRVEDGQYLKEIGVFCRVQYIHSRDLVNFKLKRYIQCWQFLLRWYDYHCIHDSVYHSCWHAQCKKRHWLLRMQMRHPTEGEGMFIDASLFVKLGNVKQVYLQGLTRRKHTAHFFHLTPYSALHCGNVCFVLSLLKYIYCDTLLYSNNPHTTSSEFSWCVSLLLLIVINKLAGYLITLFWQNWLISQHWSGF